MAHFPKSVLYDFINYMIPRNYLNNSTLVFNFIYLNRKQFSFNDLFIFQTSSFDVIIIDKKTNFSFRCTWDRLFIEIKNIINSDSFCNV
jgi:hypothetical protein